jgi:hypothetical protein
MAGYFVTRRAAGATAASTDPVAGTTSASSGTPAAATEEAAEPEAVATDAVETDAAAPAANPSSGQTVATDEPAVTDGTDVSVELTSWGWNAGKRSAQVRGYAAGVVEGGGTCTLILTQGARQVTADVEAMPDASTTACGSVAVGGSQLGAGSWQAVLRYESPTSSGSSAPVQIDVPR